MKTYIGNTRYKILDVNGQRMMMAVNNKPYDAEIEYIQHDINIDGIPIIDTGVISKAYLLLEITYMTTKRSTANSSKGRVGSAESIWDDGKSFIFYPMGTYNSDTRILVQVGNISASFTYLPNVITNKFVTFKQIGDGNQFYYNNLLYESDSPTYKTYDSNSNLIISFYEGLTIKKVTLTYQGVNVRDYIPVRVGSTGYLYDKVSGQLFGNSGTGNFILGPDK